MSSYTFSHIKRWEDTTFHELQSYLRLWFLMRLQPSSNMREYWPCDPLMSSAVFPKMIPRDRFDVLMSVLHFAVNEGKHDAG